MTDYAQELESLRALLPADARPEEARARLALYLYENLPHYDWVGIYRLEADSLVLDPWQGPAETAHPGPGPACLPSPVAGPVRGARAPSGRTRVVPDVAADPRCLARFAQARSEIVVPIIVRGRFWGEIAVASTLRSAFSPADARFLEAAAKLLAGLL